jgi:hypothetical protein
VNRYNVNSCVEFDLSIQRLREEGKSLHRNSSSYNEFPLSVIKWKF